MTSLSPVAARIHQIADEIDASGFNPTLAAIRQKLGSGSFSTISEAMKQWRSEKAKREAGPSREPAPQAITELLAQVGTEVWATAVSQANNRLASEREALDHERQSLDVRYQEANDLADQLHAELDTARMEIEQLRATLTVQQDLALTRGETITALQQEVAVAVARVAEINVRAEQLQGQLDTVSKQNNDLVKALADSRQTVVPRTRKATE